MTHLHIALWGVLPYLALAVLVAGTVWRYRYDRFGVTTRSSQLHESRMPRIGGPLFHHALFLVIGGPVTGLLVPETVTRRLRISEAQYHAVALAMGGAAGVAAVTGLALLLYRGQRVPAVRRATSRSDRVTYPLLALVLLAGLTATASSVTTPYDYRLGVAVWFRSLFTLDPDVTAMAHAPLVHHMHPFLALALFALWPFSRLVHAFAVPVGYAVRPYVVYRSRGRATGPGARPVTARRRA
ncbi:respiratory nitrate reductase subunit gamma [Streptomyces sp. NPDC048045]|uniref:respiratory nitrate reductase subunit gamma n=1 Tax=Streptomyces sp. NPDC048045 TaxID=3154710 RepID=UPI0034327B2C